MNERVLKCLYDIKIAVEEIDSFFETVIPVGLLRLRQLADPRNDLQLNHVRLIPKTN
jgi:hypothetical protein